MKNNKKEYYIFLITFFVLWLTITVFVMNPNIIRKIKSSISDLIIKEDIIITKKNTTKEQLMVQSQEFNFKIYSNDVEISNTTPVKTNDRLVNNNDEYLISVLGDVNKDGLVDVSDLARTYKIYRNIVDVSKVERIAADSNQDNNINSSDLARTYKIYRNLLPDDPTVVTKYAVMFDSDGGTLVDSQIVIEGDKAKRPKDPEKEGYEFINWTVNGVVFDFNNPIRGDITLKANYREIKNSLEGYFLNTQINYGEEGENKFITSNESLVFKTENGKIIMVDTADNKPEVQNVIINKLREISGNEQITIDYLLVSHSHGDHVGNLEYIITHPNITIKNIIYKKENLTKTVENILNRENVQNVINSKNINLIDVASLNKTIHKITVDNVTMSLFNLSDAYENYTSAQCRQTFYAMRFSSSIRNTNTESKLHENITKNGKYIYLNSLDPDDNTLKYSDSIEDISSDLGFDENGNPIRRYYAYLERRNDLCSDNANSIVLLLEVNTSDGKKYVYVPNDLTNNGYPFYGIENSVAANEFYVPKIYSTGIDYVFENSFDEQLNNIDNSWTITNNHFVESNNSIKVARETRVANRIRNYLGEDKLNDIVIYQQSHHGYSNSKDAVDTLNLNRSGVYSIATNRQTGKNSPDSLLARSYHYVLKNTTRLSTGGSGSGIYCYIKNNNSYNCQRVQ